MANNYITLESEAIKAMDRAVDSLGIEWNRGGRDIRAVMLDFMHKAYWEGREIERMLEIQKCCKHQFVHDSKGGFCGKCGATTVQCSSD